MTPILFKIGALNIYTYGTFLILALLLSSLLLFRLAKQQSRNTEAVFDLVIFSVMFGLIVARITYFFVYRDQFTSFSDLFKIWEGGLVSWGGFVAGIAAFILILKMYKEPFAPWLDLLSITSLLGLAIGRFGSFMSGELAGKPTALPIAIRGVYPVTIIESIVLLFLAVIFFLLISKNRIHRSGEYFILVILCYSFVRFILDFLRTDQVISAGMTMTQMISAVIIVSIILYLALRALISKKGAGYARSKSHGKTKDLSL